jgi:2'-5' RNA ligase
METEYANSRFAVYLIPPYHVARAVTEIHQVLAKQFGFTAASRFQVHATIQGFFKGTDGLLDPLVERLDGVFASQHPIPVHFCGVRRDSVGLSLDISCIGQRPNPELVGLHERVSDVVRPLIAPDCDFVADSNQPFEAHITLAFRDIPPELQDEVLDYLQDAPLPTEPFTADTFQFAQFFSQDWAGAWEKTLTWRLLRSWRL